MTELERHEHALKETLGDRVASSIIDRDELCIVVTSSAILSVSQALRDQFQYEQLIDLCCVDYSSYGQSEWKTEKATGTGFSRGVSKNTSPVENLPRYAVVYHLLSLSHNRRLRVKTYLGEDFPQLSSVISIWPSANWYEREAFDMMGILFDSHPDLRRILTDYGFVGHPLRKDFPLIGQVEMRYDEKLGRVIYQPVTIEPRTLVPKVIPHDNRYGKKDGR